MPNYSLHIMQNPAGTYSFVGSIPACLFRDRPATKADSLSGAAYRLGDGSMAAAYCPTFDTAQAAEAYAHANGVNNAIVHHGA